MKRLATLFILTILVATAGFAKPQKYKDLSGNIAVKGELTKEYRQSPAGTPVIIRRVVKMKIPVKAQQHLLCCRMNGMQRDLLRMRWGTLPYPLRKPTGNSGSRYT